ncbi:Inner centromere protein, ARK binding region [Seminavis robusta]|uniref:Inner centromere protein, ARK binding region n=1 Tax=Seminavis robusta TaxID=568900 RepID=A0A9N8E1T6_9STRA|nr:Inner centromere protein, ARK binding region [Seminavis robusta]|eukprot:Sro421_g139520.1 Inner centromere protein, ARK binding region (861) ;mRNA; r:25118-27972
MAYRNKLTTAPALVNEVIATTNTKRNGSIFTLQEQMESTSNWLDEAITSAKRKVVEGTGVSIQEANAKKAKTIGFKKENGAPLSPIPDKENSPNQDAAIRVPTKPPPSAVKRRVNGLRVVDLRKELKSKGRETKGLKKDLQQRLLEAYSSVENMVSPSKAKQPNDSNHVDTETTTQSAVKKKDPPASQADDGFPDSDSVEVVVFEPSFDAREQHPTKHDQEKKAVASKQKATKTTFQDIDTKVNEATKPTVPDERETEQQVENSDVMVVEPTKEDSSMDSSRKSMMDCSSSSSSPPVKSKSITDSSSLSKATTTVPYAKEQAVAHASSSETGILKTAPKIKPSNNHSKDTLSSEPKNTFQDNEQEAANLKRSVASMSSRKLSQETSMKSSLDSDRSNMSVERDAERNVTADTKLHGADCKSDMNGDQKQDEDSKTQEKSPMKRRVQAAIQMLTAKSTPAKPKPTTTPGKLPWLQNKTLHPVTDSKATAPPTQKQKEVFQPMSQAKPKTSSKPITANSLRRPGMGLASAVGSTSTSATKPSRLAAGASSSEARKARIAEMREKSNKVAQPSAYAAKAYVSTLPSIKSQTTGGEADDKETKRKLLTAQMRAKAARNLGASATSGLQPINESSSQSVGNQTKTSTENKPLKETSSQVSGSVVTTFAAKVKASNDEPKQSNGVGKQVEENDTEADNSAKASAAKTGSVSTVPVPMKVTHSQQTDIQETQDAKTPGASSKANETAELHSQALSPLDTYEISDREDSESDEESESEDESREPRKKVPDWAQKANLLPALERQFASGDERIDPDEIFPEVKTCDLQAIFNNKRSRYVKRTSSGNWSRDRVTAAEKLTYKRTMGYAKS